MLIVRNLKIRYKNSSLGFFWSLLSPLFMILIYAVFAHILKFTGSRPHYLQFLVVGLIVWHYLLLCLNDSLYTIAGSANLVKKTAFPRMVLPLAMTLANLLNFLLTGIVLVIYLVATGMSFQMTGMIPLVVLTQTALCLGLALVLSSVNVFFRDTEHILGLVTLAWFFLTPIFYPIDLQRGIMGPAWDWALFLNPMTGIVDVYRVVLMSEPVSSLTGIAVSFGVSWVVFIVGLIVFQRLQVRFGDEL